MRTPQDTLGQRRLVFELRHAIDRCIRRPDTTALAHLDELLADNPRSSQSTHVRYNIGSARRFWLDTYTASRASVAPLPGRGDGHSLAQ